MARSNARPIRGALKLLDLRDLTEVSGNFAEDWANDRRPLALLRDALNADSDFSFVKSLRAKVAACMQDNGLPERLSASIAAEVLANPTFAAIRPVGEAKHIRQALVLSRAEDMEVPFEVLVRLDACVRPRHIPKGEKKAVPGVVTKIDFEAALLDLEGDADIGTLLRHYMQWDKEFPEPPRPSRNASAKLVILGDPRGLGSNGTPGSWRDDLSDLARAFDAIVAFDQGPGFTSTLGETVNHVFRFEPFLGGPPKTAAGNELPYTKIDARNESYERIFSIITSTLASLNDSEDGTESTEKTELKAGAKVYHRKVGQSRKFDRFDAGSTKPCSHNATYVRFSGPKSLKGFERRYADFEPSWMYHCPRYPNCGVYAVFRPEA